MKAVQIVRGYLRARFGVPAGASEKPAAATQLPPQLPPQLPLDDPETFLRALDIEYQKIGNGRVYVRGDLNISMKGLTQLPDLRSVIVQGSFSCSNNALTSLAGAPQEIGVSFFCDRNNLRDLTGAPQYVTQSFNCNANRDLESLQGGPVAVGFNYHCSGNAKLRDLHGAPDSFKEIVSDFGAFSHAQGVPPDLLMPPRIREAIEQERRAHDMRIRAATSVVASFELTSAQIPRLKIPRGQAPMRH